MKKYLTSESVTEGHPDKICDQISDCILDEALKQDKTSKVAVEATIKDDLLLIYGEINSKANLDYDKIARKVLRDIGYNDEFKIIQKIGKQSTEINNAVCKENVCAGDQGIMFGYASNETKELMSLPIQLANALALQLSKVRKSENRKILQPDGKTQVTVEYNGDTPIRVDTIIIASQHYENIKQGFLKKYISEKVINPVIPKKLIDNKTKILINTSGSFIIGGPYGDSGTTGRKIVADTYGGTGHIGGGCLSSKDPSKVDRSATYYARYVAKSIVANKLARKCEIQVAYAIGKAKPISLNIETFNTNTVPIENIYQLVENNFDFSVSNIIKELNLLEPIYYKTSAYGHFGRKDINLPWERVKKL